MKSVNPATGEILARFEEHSATAVDQLLDKAQERFLSWKRTEVGERAGLCRKLAETLKSRRLEMGELITAEMGKPIKQSLAELDKCTWACEFYADQGPGFLNSELVSTEARESYVSFEPLGVVLAVMPWNFPFWQTFRCAIPALIAGNTMVLKHASNVMGCALKMEELFRSAGFPDGAFTALKIPSEGVARVIEHPAVKAVSLTGSTPAGRAVAQKAGRELKKCVLELGGSDAYLILEDADLKLASRSCAQGRLQNTGQSCIAAKRFIVLEAIHDEFLKLFAEELRSYSYGDPMQEDSKMGPMAREDLRQGLHEQVQKSVDLGAKLHFGGEIPGGAGAYYPATLLSEVRPGMPAFDEELFGPVAALIKAKDEAHAIWLANQSSFGLGAGVFTQDLDRGAQIAQKELEAGSCFVNSFVKSDPRLPFGGIKDSGFGRELGSYGIREFVNVKSVYIS